MTAVWWEIQEPVGTVSTELQTTSEEVQPAFKPLKVTELEEQEEAARLVVEEENPVYILPEEVRGVFAFVNAVREKSPEPVQEGLR